MYALFKQMHCFWLNGKKTGAPKLRKNLNDLVLNSSKSNNIHFFAVLVDLLGLDSLTSSFGMLVLCRGIASILGPPLAGLVYDLTAEYNASFFLAGAFFVTGGLISFVAYFMDKRRNTK